MQLSDIEEELGKLDSTKGCKSNSIPAKFLKEYHSICNEPLFNIFKTSLNGCVYDQDLIFADIAPVHKGEDATPKKNNGQISLLPVVSKVYEKIIRKQIAGYAEKFFKPFLCGYRKGFNPQYALLSLLERWRISLDNKGYGGAVLMYLSKAFDTLTHCRTPCLWI